MPIAIKYKNGQHDVVLGETDRDYFLMNREGKVFATLMNGHGTILYREDIRGIELIPKAEWDKAIEEHKKAEEEKKAAEEKRIEDLKAAKEQARLQVEKDNAEAAAAKAKAIEDARPINRLKRFLHIG